LGTIAPWAQLGNRALLVSVSRDSVPLVNAVRDLLLKIGLRGCLTLSEDFPPDCI
jgi:hypothetical protein